MVQGGEHTGLHVARHGAWGRIESDYRDALGQRTPTGAVADAIGAVWVASTGNELDGSSAPEAAGRVKRERLPRTELSPLGRSEVFSPAVPRALHARAVGGM